MNFATDAALSVAVGNLAPGLALGLSGQAMEDGEEDHRHQEEEDRYKLQDNKYEVGLAHRW